MSGRQVTAEGVGRHIVLTIPERLGDFTDADLASCIDAAQRVVKDVLLQRYQNERSNHREVEHAPTP